MGIRSLGKLFLLFSFVSLSVRSEDAQVWPLPDSMASLGDSITSGAFASFKRINGIYPWAQVRFFNQLTNYVLSGRNPFVIERKNLSWSTGQDKLHRMTSHADRIVKLRNPKKKGLKLPDLMVKNFALTGAQVHDVREHQLPELMKWSEKKLGQTAPDYVTILIGANDLCSDFLQTPTTTGQYIDDLSYVVDTLLEKSPNTKILVSAMPQVQKVRSVLAKAKLTGGPIARTCNDIWQLIKVCNRLTLVDDPKSNEELQQQVQDYFEATGQMVEDRRAAYGDRVRFATGPYQTEIHPNDVSMDCFHPAPSGQDKIANSTWKDSWWSDQTGTPLTNSQGH